VLYWAIEKNKKEKEGEYTMKKALILISILMVVTLLTSCAQQNEREQNFRTGSQGLVMRFLPNQPPPQIYDDQQFDVQLEVANRGAYTVGETFDTLHLSGFDHNILRGISVQGAQLEPLEGKSLYNPVGSLDYVGFQADPLQLSQAGIDRYPFTLMATLCYKYETIASATVCIDPDPFGPQQREKVCSASSVGLGTQGAPIAVTNVEVQPSKQKTRFKITISNVGGGAVYKEGTDFKNKCSPYDSEGLQFDEIDFVAIEDIAVSGQSIRPSCRPVDKDGRHVRLVNGQAVINCEFLNPVGATAYVSPLVIRLSYGYRSTIRQSVEITTSG